jgi:hypothetical protein
MRRGLDIAARTRKLDVDNRLPVKLYYRTADNLLKQANIYREEGNIIDLYILLLRFSRYVNRLEVCVFLLRAVLECFVASGSQPPHTVMSVSFHFSLYYTGDLLTFEVALLIPRDSTDEVLHASSNHFYCLQLGF